MNSMSIGMALVGIGAVAAGVVGVLLPPPHRFAALLALVAGAGIGVVVLALGVQENAGNEEDVFLVGAALGLVTVLTTLAAVWRRAAADR